MRLGFKLWQVAVVLILLLTLIRALKDDGPNNRDFEDIRIRIGSEREVNEPIQIHSNQLKFYSIGDYGVSECERTKAHKKCKAKTQAAVAQHINTDALSFKPDFILSLGDAFYPFGPSSLEDNQFRNSFEKPYNLPNIKDLHWQMTIGDHDHCGNMSALLAYGKGQRSQNWEEGPGLHRDSFQLPSPYYHKTFTINPGKKLFHIIVIDSVGLEGSVSEWSERRFSDKLNRKDAGASEARLQWAWLESTLAKASLSANPRLVMLVGHRPVFSAATRGRTIAELRVSNRLRTLLSQFGVSAYLHGHDHIMQHIHCQGVEHMGNGVGGFSLHKINGTLWPNEGEHKLIWSSNSFHGFARHTVSSLGMRVEFVQYEHTKSPGKGSVVHQVDVPFRGGFI